MSDTPTKTGPMLVDALKGLISTFIAASHHRGEECYAKLEDASTPLRVALEAIHEATGDYPFCHGARDGDCFWEQCPQLRDNEPEETGRHCPLDLDNEEEPPFVRLTLQAAESGEGSESGPTGTTLDLGPAGSNAETGGLRTDASASQPFEELKGEREEIARIIAPEAFAHTVNEDDYEDLDAYRAHVFAQADLILSALPIQPTLPGEVVEAMEAARINGPLRYTKHEERRDGERASWCEIECVDRKGWHVCQCPDEEDAALIVLAINYIRTLINAYRSEGKSDE